MQYGEHYQTQKYVYGIGRISIDFIELDDHDNGWIPKTAPTRLEESYQRLYYYLEDELGSTKRRFCYGKKNKYCDCN
ncbi:hypothetical protein [Abyssisolibacter fermentans]|uniref:hypothetical protein n=1 Tax=Abyssisolibacter fermentans TaxID=1766203 RepID=UPI00082E879D|nr:hypothetical protein [Abyssisolibacter fermentans]